MQYKEWAKRLIAANPQIKPSHKTIGLNRRELLAHGYIAASATVVAPSLLSLFSEAAYGDDAACVSAATAGASKCKWLVFDRSGGPSNGMEVVVGGKGGQTDYLPAGSYQTLGIAPDGEPGKPGVTLQTLGGLQFWPNSALFAGLTGALSADAQAHLAIITNCVRNGDDQQNNTQNPGHMLRLAGGVGSLVPAVASNDSLSGGNSMALMPDTSFKPPIIRNGSDAISLVQPGVLATVVGDDNVKKIIATIKKMSEEELKRFQGRSIPDQLKTLIDCGHEGALKQLSQFTPDMLDPSKDAVISALFTANDELTLGAEMKLILDGYAGGGTFVLGGNDYHGQGLTVQTTKNRDAGRLIGKALQAAFSKGQPLVVFQFADGATAAGMTTDTNFPNLYAQVGDSGQRHISLVFLIHPTMTTAQLLKDPAKVQVGAFNSTGAVEKDPALGGTIMSDSVPNLAKWYVYLFLSLTGREGDLEKVVGDNPFGAAGDALLPFNKLA